MARPRKLQSAQEPATEGMVRVVVLRDYWPTDDDIDRVRQGSLIEVTPDEAMDGIEAGTMKRFRE
jgi:hypothetical protein